MRRRISALLVLIIAFTFTLGDAVPLLAEGETELPVEAVEVETAEADSIDAQGLSLDGEWTVEPVDAPEDVTPTADEVAAATAEYAVITAEGTDVYDAQGAVIARISAGSAVLLVEASDGMMTVAFNTDRGVITGRVDEGAARRMTGAEAAALQDAMAESETVVLYQDNLDRPLPFAGCTYPEASPETEAEADPEGADAEEIKEPEETEEPEGETESDNAEADDEAEAKAIEAEADDEEVAVAFETQAPQEAPALFALESEEALVPVGDTYEIAALDANGGVIDSSVLTYETSDASVADVSDDGVVTAFQAGSADITVSYQGQVLTSAIKVPQEPEAIVLSASTGTLGVKETYGDLDVTMLPANSAASITWSTSNAKIATVDEDGTIVGVKTGSATITATTRNGKKAACKVTVRKAPSKVSVTKSVTLGEAQDARVKANLPSGSASAITWTTSDESVALVAMDGTVTGVSAGTATVTATTYNGKKGSCTVTVRPAPEEIILNRSEANLNVKGTMTLSAQLSPAKAMAVNSFASSDPAVATVNGSGKVTAKGLGTATITATTYNGKIAECEVHVYKAPTKVALNRTKATLGVGMTLDLDETVFAADANPDVKWSSSNPKIATVSDGTVTAMKAGTATITVKTSNGKDATCKVTVKGAPNSLTLNTGAITLGANGMTARLEARVPNGTIAGTIQYASSDESVATVDERGLVTAGQAGTATITATTYNGKTAECQVTVLPAPAHVALDASEITVGVGQQLSITASAQGPNGSETITAFTYFLDQDSDNGAISLNASTGAIKGLKPGTAVVNVRTHNGVTATPCVVTVLPAPTGIKLSAGSGTIGVGEAYTGLSYKLIAPAGCDDTMAGVTWSSSNSKIAKVDRDGTITGVKAGTATITAKTSNGQNATCKITVKAAPTKVTLSPASLNLSAGGMCYQLNYTVSGNIKRWVSFKSDDESVAYVDEDGLITTINPGKATITARTYNGLTAQCAVSVAEKPSRVYFADTNVELYVNETHTPEIQVFAASGSSTIADLSLDVDDARSTGSVSINAGAVTAKATGRVYLNATTHNGVTADKPCVITIIPAPTSIRLDASAATIGAGENFPLQAILDGDADFCDDVSWKSSNEKIASVDAKGNVSGIAAGSATITATTCNGLTASCKFTVKKAPTSIKISPANGSLAVGKSGRYSVTLSKDSGGSYTFKSSNESIATVSNTGKVTVKATGRVTITVRTYNGLEATATLACGVPNDMPVSLASYVSSYSSGMSNADKIEYVIYVAQSKIGCKYVSPSFGPNTFDCVGLTYYCYKQAKISTKDTPAGQANDSRYTKITNWQDLKRGDIVCFKSDTKSNVNHVGLYLGNGWFIHASSSAGKVVVSELKTSGNYYNRNFVCGRRILN